MALVRFIQGREKQSLTLTSEGLQLIKTLCQPSATQQEILKSCCQAGVCPVILNYKLR